MNLYTILICDFELSIYINFTIVSKYNKSSSCKKSRNSEKEVKKTGIGEFIKGKPLLNQHIEMISKA